MSDHKDLPTSTIRQAWHIPASPESVYDALTIAEIHALFTGSRPHLIPAWEAR